MTTQHFRNVQNATETELRDENSSTENKGPALIRIAVLAMNPQTFKFSMSKSAKGGNSLTQESEAGATLAIETMSAASCTHKPSHTAFTNSLY